jgi:hypothetical protein
LFDEGLMWLTDKNQGVGKIEDISLDISGLAEEEAVEEQEEFLEAPQAAEGEGESDELGLYGGGKADVAIPDTKGRVIHGSTIGI